MLLCEACEALVNMERRTHGSDACGLLKEWLKLVIIEEEAHNRMIVAHADQVILSP
jgi:RNA polymerase subunit RPABC4/transcription elongation factor Spt4